MVDKSAAIDRIESSAKRKAQWVNMAEPLPPVAEAAVVKPKKAEEVDSLESLEAKDPLHNQKKLESSAGFWVTAWSRICSLFGYSASAVTASGEGSSNRPGGGVQPVSGSHTLEAPWMFDQKKFMQLLKETCDSLNQVTETLNEADEEFTKSEKSMQMHLESLKIERDLYKEGGELVKIKFILHQKMQREVNKKLGDAKTEALEAAATERYWGWWKTGTTWGLVAVTVTAVAVSVIATSGLSLGAAGAVMTGVVQVATPVAGALNAGTSIMKGVMTQQANNKRGTVTSLNHLSGRFSEFLIPEDMAQMNQMFELSLKIVSEHLKRQEEKNSNAIKSIVSDIAPRSGG